MSKSISGYFKTLKILLPFSLEGGGKALKALPLRNNFFAAFLSYSLKNKK